MTRHATGTRSASSDAPTLRAKDFEYVRRLLLDESAIILERAKGYFAESRLAALAAREGFASATELIDRLRTGRPDGPRLRRRIVEAMTLNETSFFRDCRAFEEVRRSVLPELIARRLEARRLRIWSAACSSGQEPYSLAMLILEHFPGLKEWDLSILASDLSAEMLERARRGRYKQIEVDRGLPQPLLAEYFRREGPEWAIVEAARRPVEFRPINLADEWPALRDLDLIVLRNVLIYFGLEGRKAVLDKVARALAPHGYLWLGASETTINLDDRFGRVDPERGSFYRLRRPADAGLDDERSGGVRTHADRRG